MPTITKDALYPTEVHLRDGRRFNFAGRTEHFAKRAQEMVNAGLHIPVCWEHQDKMKPVDRAGWQKMKAEEAKLTIDHVKGASLDDKGVLNLSFDTDDDEAKLLKKAKFVSPHIEWDYRDPSGRVWAGPSILHLAATNNPVQYGQKPFALSQDVDLMERQEPVRLGVEDFKEPVSLAQGMLIDQGAHEKTVGAWDKTAHAHRSSHEEGGEKHHMDAAALHREAAEHNRNAAKKFKGAGGPRNEHAAMWHEATSETHDAQAETHERHAKMRGRNKSASMSQDAVTLADAAPPPGKKKKKKPIEEDFSDLDLDDSDLDNDGDTEETEAKAETETPSAAPPPPENTPNTSAIAAQQHPKMAELLTLLTNNGNPLPDDTDAANIVDRLITSLMAKQAAEGGGLDDEEAQPQSAPVISMSENAQYEALKKKVIENGRKDIERRLNDVLNTRVGVTPYIVGAIKKKLESVSLSVNDAGDLVGGDVLAQVEALEMLPRKKADDKEEAEAVDLSQSPLADPKDDSVKQKKITEEMVQMAGGVDPRAKKKTA